MRQTDTTPRATTIAHAHAHPTAFDGLRVVMALGLTLLALLAYVSTASAHEHREVGDYEITIGFTGEPALVGEPNGLDLRVQLGHGDDGTPVEGLDETLKAEIRYGDQSMPLDLREVWNTPGAYTSDVIPSAEGAYTFHITGTIEGNEIDETFTSGPETFAEVGGVEALTFPAAGATDADADSAVQDAQDDADSARMLATIAIAVGAAGLALGVIGMAAARRARPTA